MYYVQVLKTKDFSEVELTLAVFAGSSKRYPVTTQV